jgi:dihydropyrimidine dehydrogenase (NAD+) subunit PreA
LNRTTALEEAARCLLCDDPPCRAGCPAGIDPRVFIRKIRFHDLAGAARHLRCNNILAGACAELCPTGRLCEGRCLSEKLSRPIDIAGLQRFVCDWERQSGEMQIERITPSREAVAVVGAGPAGLACAAELAQRGFAVTVFDSETEAGGLLRHAIPEFRLPREILDQDISLVEALGVAFRLGERITSLDDLLAGGFAAVFVGAGTGRSIRLMIAGEDSPGVRPAVPFLRRAKTGKEIDLGFRVAVIGGGDTAVDAARVAKRMGCEVAVLYRRTQLDMPAYRPQVDAAWGEGVEFLFQVVPVAFETGDGFQGVRLQRVQWETSGRGARRFETVGEPFLFPCDDVIVAVGLQADSTFGLPLDRAGLIRHDPAALMTERPGVFVGGDVATGPATAVAAVGAGREAARRIDAYLPARGTSEERCDIYRAPRVDLSVTFCGVRFENPFVLAAGPPTDDLEMLRDALRAGWAGAVLKTTSVEGTPVRLAYPMMSAVEFEGRKVSGLGNIDLISEHHIEVVESRVRALKEEFPSKVVIASIMGEKKEDWQSLVRRLEMAGVDMIECSFSCPQGTLGSRPGFMLGQDPALVRTVAGWVKEAAQRVPVVIKITPQVTDIVEVARAAQAAGCDAICASNTIPALMGIDLDTWVPHPDVMGVSAYSGLSGPAIRPITLRTIAEIARQVGIPMTGTGGPVGWRDAAEFMLVGATTVQFCTAVMRFGYDIIEDLCEGLAHYLDQRGLHSAEALIGRALPQIVSHEELPRGHSVKARIDTEKCIRDDLCFIACRDGGHRAIVVGEERLPKVDDERCVGCGLCRLVCPVDECITMEQSAGE